MVRARAKNPILIGILTLLLIASVRGARAVTWAEARALARHDLGAAAIAVDELLEGGTRPLAGLLLRQELAFGLGGGTGAGAWMASLDRPDSDPMAGAVLALQDAILNERTEGLRAAADALGRSSPPESTLDRYAVSLVRARACAVAGDTAAADSLLAALPVRPAPPGAERLAAAATELKLLIGPPGEAAEGLAALAQELETRGDDWSAARVWIQLMRSPNRFRTIDTATRALSLARKVGDPGLAALALAYRAFQYEQRFDFRASRRDGSRAVPVLRDRGEQLPLVYTLLTKGWAEWRLGEPGPAEASFQEAVERADAIGHQWSRVRARMNLGVVYDQTGRLQEAGELIQWSLEQARANGDRKQESMLLNNLASSHLRAFRHDLAIPLYQQALSIQRELGELWEQALTLSNLGLSNGMAGHAADARVFYEEALEVAGQIGEPRAQIPPLTRLGDLLWSTGRPEEAVETLERALALAEGAADTHAQGEIHFLLGTTRSGQGRWEEARDHLWRAVDLRAQRRDAAGEMMARTKLGHVLTRLGQPAEGIRVLEDAEPLTPRVGRATRFRLELERIRIGWAQGQLDQARLVDLVRQLDEWRNSSQDFGWFAYESGMYAAMQMLCETLVEAEDPALKREMFRGVQRIKSRSTVEYVQPGQGQIQPDVPDSLLAARRTLNLRGRRLRQALAEADAPDSLGLELGQTEAALRSLQGRIRALDARYDRALGVAGIGLEAAQRWAREHRALLVDVIMPPGCYRGDDCDAFALVLDGATLEVLRLGDLRQLRLQATAFRDLIRTPPADADPDVLRVVAEELGARLLGPVAHRFAAVDRLVVAGDGVLNLIPLVALRLEDRYLIETIPVRTVRSLADLNRTPRRGAATDERWDLAIWSDRGASGQRGGTGGGTGKRSEVAGLLATYRNAKGLHWRSDMDDPLEELATSGLLRARVIHFATHGSFDEEAPWRSGVQLSPDALHRLDATDVYNLDFESDLVTLAACETAVGETRYGVAFTGFAQALMESGANSVLATLWEIEDTSAARFAERFYRELSQGRSKLDALTAAQRSFLNGSEFAHPFFWGAYTLLGDTDAGVPLQLRGVASRARTFGLVALVSAGLVAILVAARRRRRIA